LERTVTTSFGAYSNDYRPETTLALNEGTYKGRWNIISIVTLSCVYNYDDFDSGQF
jgi:hypothetical protein